MQVQDHLSKLGYPAKDRVTGFVGVVTSVGFDLYGCIQYVLTPPAGEKGKQEDGRWFDANRVEITSWEPVMSRPEFVKEKGSAAKPIPR